jgi:hypothetical protein
MPLGDDTGVETAVPTQPVSSLRYRTTASSGEPSYFGLQIASFPRDHE